MGAYGPIKDVYKTSTSGGPVAQPGGGRAGQTPPIPENSITKPPSAQVPPDQVDTDSLPDYPVLDAILERYVDRDEGRTGIVAAGFDRELVVKTLRMVDTAEQQAPAVSAGHEDLRQGVREGPAASDHQSVARARVTP